ncbi:50S ribosomal subunit protein L32 [Gammaproteobacteria bacterium]
MAVPQNRKSASKRGMHRSHDHLSGPALSIEQGSGEIHRRHYISRDGYYRGQKVLEIKKQDA